MTPRHIVACFRLCLLGVFCYLTAAAFFNLDAYFLSREGVLLYHRHFSGRIFVTAGCIAGYALCVVARKARSGGFVTLAGWAFACLFMAAGDRKLFDWLGASLIVFGILNSVVAGLDIRLARESRLTDAPNLAAFLRGNADLFLFLGANYVKLTLPVGIDIPINAHVWPLEETFQPTSFGFIAMAATAASLLPLRPRRIAFLLVSTLLAAVVMADLLYIRFFGLLPTVSLLNLSGQLSDFRDSLLPLLRLRDLVLIWDLPLWIVILLRPGLVIPALERRQIAMFLSSVTLIALTPFALGFFHSWLEKFRTIALDETRILVRTAGLPGYHAYDLFRTFGPAPGVEPELLEDMMHSYRTRKRARSPYFGAARGKNLVLLMSEALEDFVIDLRIDGQEITPHLNALARASLRFSPVYDQTHRGQTSDGSFISLNSLYPLASQPTTLRFKTNRYDAIPGLLAEKGYATLAAFAFRPDFWGRDQLFPRYGFQRLLSERDFPEGERIGFGLGDIPFLEQTADRLAQLPEPFCGYMITLTTHAPYHLDQEKKSLRLGKLEGTPLGDYLHCAHYYDRALGRFLEKLREKNLADRTVVAIYGDHNATLLQVPQYQKLRELGEDRATWRLCDRVAFLVHLPDSGPRGTIDRPGGQIDIAPTIAALFGIDPDATPFLGRDLTASDSSFIAFRDGAVMDEERFLLQDGRCLDAATLAPLPFASCAEMRARRDREFAYSDALMEGNLIGTVRPALAVR